MTVGRSAPSGRLEPAPSSEVHSVRARPTRAKAEACGKVILLGEHFVVPDAAGEAAPAIAFPLRGRSCEVEVAVGATPGCIAEGLEARILPSGQPARADVESRMTRALAAAAEALGIDASAFEVRSRGTLPLSRGFGSSAAFSVALARALDRLASAESESSRDLFVVTNAIETVFHGSPSGLDTAVILAERPIRFHRGKIARFVDPSGVDLVAVDSGPREAAAGLIARVRELRSREPLAWSKMAAPIAALVDRTEDALASADGAAVGAFASRAHGILAELGLTDARIEAVLADAKKNGALGGKVSGAGAGGAVVLVARAGDGPRLASALSSLGHDVVAVTP